MHIVTKERSLGIIVTSYLHLSRHALTPPHKQDQNRQKTHTIISGRPHTTQTVHATQVSQISKQATRRAHQDTQNEMKPYTLQVFFAYSPLYGHYIPSSLPL